jgi:hypothetical protein
MELTWPFTLVWLSLLYALTLLIIYVPSVVKSRPRPDTSQLKKIFKKMLYENCCKCDILLLILLFGGDLYFTGKIQI